VFGVAVALSGYYLAQGPVFGASGDANARSYRAYNSPLLYLQTPAGKQAAHNIVFIVGDGAADGYYLQQSRLFAQTLQQMQMQVTLLIAPGGHSWTLWTTLFTRAAPLVEPA
jgi:S-formylglutathione hydrolase FrmB